MPRTASAFAATQAAWRFYANERVSLPTLHEPLLERGREAVAQACRPGTVRRRRRLRGGRQPERSRNGGGDLAQRRINALT